MNDHWNDPDLHLHYNEPSQHEIDFEEGYDTGFVAGCDMDEKKAPKDESEEYQQGWCDGYDDGVLEGMSEK